MKNKIKNYEIQTRLGSGSYGVIFKAINKTDKQQCVLKQIRMNKMTQKNKKNTLNQATIMGKLIHPFIVQYKQSFVQDDTLHIVMQYCDNGDMSMYLKMQNKKPLKQQKIWKFFIQICLGLQYIHKNKILHRDIKTLNIFLNKNQDIKIGDLGVAKMLMANDFAQTIVGTPFYLSPQLCEQKPYNEKSDIWALGCLLYQLCTFKHPFEAANQASLILKIIRGKYLPIPQFYSKQLKDVIDMCLQRDYKRRPTASMILQRSKIKQYIVQFKIEDKIKQQYQKIKFIKENKLPQQVINTLQNKQTQQNKQVQKIKQTPNKSNQKKIADNSSQQKNIQIINKQLLNNNNGPPINKQIKKLSLQKKQQYSHQKKPSISGMPQNNILLPDKKNIIEKLKPTNIFSQPKKQLKPQIPIPPPLSKQQQNNKKAKQNKQQFLKNLQKVIDNNANLKKSPIKDKIKQIQEITASAIFQHKNRLQKIDMKIQQQIKRQQQVQKIKAQNQRKKIETPSLNSHKPQQKFNLGGDRRSVPALLNKQSNKDLSNNQQNQFKLLENPLIPPLPPKNKQQIIKVKMQQPPIQPKVFDTNKNSQQKNKGVIKSKGFSQELQQQNYASNKIQQRKITDFKRKSTENISKPVLFGLDQQQKQKQPLLKNQIIQKRQSPQDTPKQSQYHSQRNIKVIPDLQGSNSRIGSKNQPQRYIFKKKPQGKQVNNSMNSRVRNKGVSNYQQLSRNARNASKYNEVTKQDEDVVANLPDRLRKNHQESSDEQGCHESEIKINRNFELKDINNSLVLQKYEQIISSKSIGNSVSSSSKVYKEEDYCSVNEQFIQKSNKKINNQIVNRKINKNLNEYQDEQEQLGVKQQKKKNNYYPQQKVYDGEIDGMMMQPSICINNNKQSEQQYIEQNQSLAYKTQQIGDENDQILDESQQMIVDCQQKQIQEYNRDGIQQQIYQVNNFNLNNNQKLYQNYTQPINQPTNSQWQFDQQPELPMLQDKQSPFFQQNNPYLMVQQQQQTIQQKRNYLQIRLQQNIKRQDQINKLMQIKIQQCQAIVPKYFDQILQFFRTKINKQDQYTQNDQKQVEQFLRKKGLTDQRKFQNIYKIMHFQMELQNTRKIIQRICKKLSQLDNNKQID